MEKTIEAVILEDGQSYGIIDKIKKYVYLTNVKDNTDFCIRKLIIDDNHEYLIGLDNEKEFSEALMLFTHNHI